MYYFDFERMQEYFPEAAKEIGALDAPYYLPAGSTQSDAVGECLKGGYFRVIGYESVGSMCQRTSYYMEIGLKHPILSGLN